MVLLVTGSADLPTPPARRCGPRLSRAAVRAPGCRSPGRAPSAPATSSMAGSDPGRRGLASSPRESCCPEATLPPETLHPAGLDRAALSWCETSVGGSRREKGGRPLFEMVRPCGRSGSVTAFRRRESRQPVFGLTCRRLSGVAAPRPSRSCGGRRRHPKLDDCRAGCPGSVRLLKQVSIVNWFFVRLPAPILPIVMHTLVGVEPSRLPRCPAYLLVDTVGSARLVYTT